MVSEHIIYVFHFIDLVVLKRWSVAPLQSLRPYQKSTKSKLLLKYEDIGLFHCVDIYTDGAQSKGQ